VMIDANRRSPFSSLGAGASIGLLL
jgi:hypothetical protein